MMSLAKFVAFSSLIGLAFHLAGCASARRSSNPGHSSHAEILRLLERQATAWNRGDLEGFMSGYWRSPDVTFSAGGRLIRGYDAMLRRFRASYPDKAAMGTLTFSDLEVTDLGADSALVLGRWRVQASDSDAGAFSLVMRRIGGQWFIIHDHTSGDAPE